MPDSLFRFIAGTIDKAHDNHDDDEFPEFNRFDVCAAYYHFSMIPVYRHLQYQLNQVLALQWRIDHKLEALKYKPGLSQEQLSTLNPNAKAIYMKLVRQHLMQDTRD
jgi:hypothetical protein